MNANHKTQKRHGIMLHIPLSRPRAERLLAALRARYNKPRASLRNLVLHALREMALADNNDLRNPHPRCEHLHRMGDNYEESCLVCGQALKGYGYGAKTSSCIHPWAPLRDENAQVEFCIYCEEERGATP